MQSTDSLKYKKSKILEIGYTKYAIKVILIIYIRCKENKNKKQNIWRKDLLSTLRLFICTYQIILSYETKLKNLKYTQFYHQSCDKYRTCVSEGRHVEN